MNASGYQTPYGGIAFTARLPQAGGTLTVTLTFPQDIPQGAVLLKCLNGACNPIPGAQLQGRTATFRVQDGSPLDADGQANGQVRDPVALGVAQGGSGQPFALYPTTLQVSQGGVAEIQVTLQPGSFLRDRVILVPVVPDPNRQDGGDVAFGFSLYPASFVLGTSPIQGRLTLSVGPDVPPGTYTLRVFASSGLTGTYQDIQVQVTQGSPSRPSLTLEASYPFKGPSELGFQGVASDILIAHGNVYALNLDQGTARYIAPLPPGVNPNQLSPEGGFFLAGSSVYRLERNAPPQLLGQVICDSQEIQAWAEAPDRSQAAYACGTYTQVKVYAFTPAGVRLANTVVAAGESGDTYDYLKGDANATGPVFFRETDTSYYTPSNPPSWIYRAVVQAYRLHPDGQLETVVLRDLSSSSPVGGYHRTKVRNRFAYIAQQRLDPPYDFIDCVRYDTQSGNVSTCASIPPGNFAFESEGTEWWAYVEWDGTTFEYKLHAWNAASGEERIWPIRDALGARLETYLEELGSSGSLHPAAVRGHRAGVFVAPVDYPSFALGVVSSSEAQVRFAGPNDGFTQVGSPSFPIVGTPMGLLFNFAAGSPPTLLRLYTDAGAVLSSFLGLAGWYTVDEAGSVWFMTEGPGQRNRLGRYTSGSGAQGLSPSAGDFDRVLRMAAHQGRVAAFGCSFIRSGGLYSCINRPIEIWDGQTLNRIATLPLPENFADVETLDRLVHGFSLLGTDHLVLARVCITDAYCRFPDVDYSDSGNLLYILNTNTGAVEAVASTRGNVDGWVMDAIDQNRLALLLWDRGHIPAKRGLLLVLRLDASPGRVENINGRRVYLQGVSPEKIIGLPTGAGFDFFTSGGVNALAVTWDGRYALLGRPFQDLLSDGSTWVVDLNQAQVVLQGPSARQGSDILKVAPSRFGRFVVLRKYIGGDSLGLEVWKLNTP